ncbi:hypothetical protein [Amycolatopsis keratiniphila]|uniref:hypothetical protein n=1 Tax=Amycolatopsis keratiniphila TaxID=129921 RepID=UPI000F5103D8|nr:hypothetical protein [Amycolatopsis keratiniphila]
MQTALISALTAAVVTLFIEYLAKPRLEARKDRIIEGARHRRALKAELMSIFATASHLKFEASVQWPREHWEKPIEDLEKRLSHAEGTLLAASPMLKREQIKVILMPLGEAVRTCGTLRQVIKYGIEGGSEAEAIALGFDAISQNAFKSAARAEIPRWHILKYRKLIKAVARERSIDVDPVSSSDDNSA